MALHVFNPENDLALACFSPHFIPPASARQMADDLSVLPVWWAESGDSVCVVSVDEARRWAGQTAGLCPEVEWTGRGGLPTETEVLPWGWSPLVVQRLLAGGVSAGCLPDAVGLGRYRHLSGRRHAVDMLAALRGSASGLGREWGDRFCGVSYYCTREQDIMGRLRQYPETLLKAPWSGSGKGLRLGRGGYVPPLSGWCRRLLREQGGVVVEPIYNKVADFALEFYADGVGGVSYTGLSVFLTTSHGTYAGNWVAAEDAKVRWLTGRIPMSLWQDLKETVRQHLAGWLGCGYKGFLGVDMMLCSVPGYEGLCVHPCVEINLRRTMGQVSIDLASLLAPAAEARFLIDYEKSDGCLLARHRDEQNRHPMVLENGKLVSGCLPLTPVTSDTHYRAVLYIDVEY